ncbi:hypothetical protein [Sphaerobacter sp.]|uniref:hypothetical protein n=1 Tax=Sphaerobacter sp. TaxID=2099654 RepID=UPI001D7A6954|nr:hypothetical protein [Sphaerobacter sp.]MBX5445328.1 PRC-barrel domain-containing protein [Sphaerobacter sp.]
MPVDHLPGSEHDWLQIQREMEAHAEHWDADFVRFDPDPLMARIRPGMPVVTRTGQKLGTVRRVYQPVGLNQDEPYHWDIYVHVDRGPFRDDLFLPSRLIGDIEGTTVRLTASRHELGAMVLDRPEFVPE